MSRKRKATKAAPIKLIWLEQIIEHKWPKKPSKATIVAVAAKLVTYGDRAGKGIYPAAETIANPLGIKRQTVFDVLKVMVAEGMLAKQGKTNYNTNIYDLKLAPKADENELESVPQSVPQSVTPRGTQSSSLSRKGERDDEYSPTPAAKAAVAGIDTDTPEADTKITTFIAAFTKAFADRPRPKTTPLAAIEPSHHALRTAIITKINAGWPHDHLVKRTLAGITNDEKRITTLAGLVASILNRLPANPDAEARKAIEAEKVAADAKRTAADIAIENVRSLEAKLIALDDEAWLIMDEITRQTHPDDDDKRIALQLDFERQMENIRYETDTPNRGHDELTVDNYTELAEPLLRFYEECVRHMRKQRSRYTRQLERSQRSTTT